MPIDSHACSCCGYHTLSSALRGTFEICPVCGWEDDIVDELDYVGGANGMSLREARNNFQSFGACDLSRIGAVRPPALEESRDSNWSAE
jgi:hypothetical protein